MSLKMKSRTTTTSRQSQIVLCIIFSLLMMEVGADSGDISSGEEPDPGEDFGIDSDSVYSQIVLCAVLFVVALGPPLLYYYSFFYTPRSLGFLRVMSMLYWCLLWVFIPFTVGCSATHCHQSSQTLYVTHLLGLVFIPIFWLIILVESWISKERELISKLDKTKPIVSFIQDLKNAQPKIIWTVECYHYETKSKRVPYVDSNGYTFYREESFKEKVTTHTESQEFNFTYWTDESAVSVEGLQKYRITELHLGREILPGDADTTHVLYRKKQEFQDRNRNKDKHMDFVEENTIPGFEAMFTAYTDESCHSCWIGELQFWVTSILGLTWAYRLLMTSKTGETFYKVKKNFYMSHPINGDVRAYRRIGDEVTSVQMETEEFTVIPIDIIA